VSQEVTYDCAEFDKVLTYFAQSQSTQTMQDNAREFEALPAYWAASDCLNYASQDTPLTVDEYFNFLEEFVVPEVVDTTSPWFIGHMTSALPAYIPRLAQKIAEMNQNLVKIETSRVLTITERKMLAVMHWLVFNDASIPYERLEQNADVCLGCFCSGGTLANITALWVARNLFIEQYGQNNLQHCVILVSEVGHYSIAKALNILGFKQDQLVKIPITTQGIADTQWLRHYLTAIVSSKTIPLALIGVAGATETGAIDELKILSQLAQEFKVYYHVDAAWGGAFLFSNSRYLLAGIEAADSVTIDGHKQLYLPMGCGLVLFKSAVSARAIEHHATYILRQGSVDLGQYSLEGSRGANSLFLHANLSILGTKGLAAILDRNLWLAHTMSHLLHQQLHFEVITEPRLNILTYRLNPLTRLAEYKQLSSTLQDNIELIKHLNILLDQLTEYIQKAQRNTGRGFVSRTQVAYNNLPIWVFRVVLANPLTTPDHLHEVLNEQVELMESSEICQSLIQKMYNT